MNQALPPDDPFCYVTTRGRVTGEPHEIEIWYAVHEGSLYLLAGGGMASDWVKNMLADPSVSVRIGDYSFPGRADVDPQDADSESIRRKVAAKYQGWEEGAELSDWARTALLIRLTPT